MPKKHKTNNPPRSNQNPRKRKKRCRNKFRSSKHKEGSDSYLQQLPRRTNRDRERRSSYWSHRSASETERTRKEAKEKGKDELASITKCHSSEREIPYIERAGLGIIDIKWLKCHHNIPINEEMAGYYSHFIQAKWGGQIYLAHRRTVIGMRTRSWRSNFLFLFFESTVDRDDALATHCGTRLSGKAPATLVSPYSNPNSRRRKLRC